MTVAEFARRVEAHPGYLGVAYGFGHCHYEVQLLYEAMIVACVCVGGGREVLRGL